MKIIIQRVSHASIVIEQQEPKTMEHGLVALLGFAPEDTQEIVQAMIKKMIGLRIFSDEQGAMNLSLSDVKGSVMAISNFTLYANCKKGRRPSFIEAAHPDQAIPLYNYAISLLEQETFPLVTGKFGADMQITLCNDGPVTIDLDSKQLLSEKGN